MYLITYECIYKFKYVYLYRPYKAVQDSYETGTDTKTYATANESKSFYEYSDL